jgi:hypothetical protein
MKACEGGTGQVFAIRLGDADVVTVCTGPFAEEKGMFVGSLSWSLGQGMATSMAARDVPKKGDRSPCSFPLEVHVKWRACARPP